MHRVIRLLAASLVLVLLSACHEQPKSPLVFGGNVWAGYEPFYLARELGYYDPAKVHLAEYTNASEVIRAFKNHLLHVAAVTLDEALLLQQDIPDLRIFLVVDYSNGADAILAQPEFHSLQQLKGKRVGVENTALGSYFLSLALDSANMNAGQIAIVPISVDEHETAFKAHRVEAVVTFEPVRTRLLREHARMLFDSSHVPGKIIDVLVTRGEYTQSYHDELSMLVQGWDKALAAIQTQPEHSAELMSLREGVSAAEFQDLLAGISITDLEYNRTMLGYNLSELQNNIIKMQAYLLQQGLIKNMSDTSLLFDGSVINGVMP